MNFKILGGISLIIGTCVGAGILALPAATAAGGFWGSCLLFLICWCVMTAGAFLLLEVSLALPEDTNLISMAKATLGLPGQLVAWFSYLLLLYGLLSAYLSGGTDIAHGLLLLVHVDLPLWLSSCAFVFVFAILVYQGIYCVDLVTRHLVIGKFVLYFLLLVAVCSFVDITHLPSTHFYALLPATTVVLTSFGYAIIIPSLRTYFRDDAKALRKTVFWGSLLPLFLYIVWIAVIQGVFPLTGDHGLLAMGHSNSPTTDLSQALVHLTDNNWVAFFIRTFIPVCMITSFLGVSLSLTDFLSDGLKIEKQGWGKLWLSLIVFLPPLLIVIFNPAIFIKSLAYAGIFCIILLIMIPILMAWSARYCKSLISTYRLFGGKTVLFLLFFISLILLFIGVFLHFS